MKNIYMSDEYDRSGNKLPPGQTNNDGRKYDQNGTWLNKPKDYGVPDFPQQSWPSNQNTGGGGNQTGGGVCSFYFLIGIICLIQFFI